MLRVQDAKRENVYNITVEDAHEYFANGILVKNCDALRYACSSAFLGREILLDSPNLPSVDELQTLQRLSLATTEQEILDRRAKEEIAAEREWQRKMIMAGLEDD